VDGIIICPNRVLWNARSSIRNNLEFDANVTNERKLQFQKLRLPMTVTDDGISISFNLVRVNAASSISDNREFDANVTNESKLQL
jgi:hypothetical protein